MRIGFIGAGKVAATLAVAFERAGEDVVAVASRTHASAVALAGRLKNCVAEDEPQAVANVVDFVFLTVTDDAVADAVSRIKWDSHMAAIHCSGALPIDALAAAKRAGTRTASFHPLQMFADIETTLRHLPGAAVTLEGDESLLDQLEGLAARIGARPIRLKVNDRALYHAAASYAGPFIIAMMQEAVRLWAILGVERDAAIAALAPLIHGTVASVEAAGLAHALGGAIARGDTRTIQGHLEALDRRAPDQSAIYRTLCAQIIPLAIEKGTLSEETASRMKRILQPQ